MDNGKVIITKTGSDEVVCEYPFSLGVLHLAKLLLDKAGNHELDGNNAELGTYSLLLGAKHVAGLEVDLPEPKDVTLWDVLLLELQYDVTSEGTFLDKNGDGDGDGEAEAVDVNPTDTAGGSSKG